MQVKGFGYILMVCVVFILNVLTKVWINLGGTILCFIRGGILSWDKCFYYLVSIIL